MALLLCLCSVHVASGIRDWGSKEEEARALPEKLGNGTGGRSCVVLQGGRVSAERQEGRTAGRRGVSVRALRWFAVCWGKCDCLMELVGLVGREGPATKNTECMLWTWSIFL